MTTVMNPLTGRRVSVASMSGRLILECRSQMGSPMRSPKKKNQNKSLTQFRAELPEHYWLGVPKEAVLTADAQHGIYHAQVHIVDLVDSGNKHKQFVTRAFQNEVLSTIRMHDLESALPEGFEMGKTVSMSRAMDAFDIALFFHEKRVEDFHLHGRQTQPTPETIEMVVATAKAHLASQRPKKRARRQ